MKPRHLTPEELSLMLSTMPFRAGEVCLGTRLWDCELGSGAACAHCPADPDALLRLLEQTGWAGPPKESDGWRRPGVHFTVGETYTLKLPAQDGYPHVHMTTTVVGVGRPKRRKATRG